ncbi:hypothetical protein [Azospirillum sp. B4]|uniref:hypothetical protein n=1 Tax=Azospirillum sp. B4 TaxID=95605 RepID=UPI00034AC402|nr:hypothetical protein [Azospirillum sp. B4]
MVRLPLLPLLAFLTLMTVVMGFSVPARAHDCERTVVTAATGAHSDHHGAPILASATADCHEAADCCCVGGMAGCATSCAGALMPVIFPAAALTSSTMVLLPAGDAAGAGLALAPALGPPRPGRDA